MATNTNGSQILSIEMGAEKRVPNYSERYNRRGGYISWGENNLYPDYLIGMMNKSGKHNSIVKGKSAIIGGNGFNKEGLSLGALDFLKNIEGDQDLDSILAKIVYDVEISGAFALSIVWGKGYSKIAKIDYIDFSKVRIGRTEDGEIYYLVSDDWSDERKCKPVPYARFDPENRVDAETIYFYQEYRPGNFWYPQPEYISAANWIEAEWEISNYHLNQLRIGFHPGMLINFNSGLPTDEEMRSIKRNTEKQFSGTSTAGKVMITFSESKEQAPTIEAFEENSSDTKFIDLNKSVEDGIFQGHRITNPALFGVKTPGELGGTNDLADSLIVFDGMYAEPKQRTYEKIFGELAKINGVTDDLNIKKYELKKETNLPIGDLLAILQATITPEQKSMLLQNAGWTPEAADQLVNKSTL